MMMMMVMAMMMMADHVMQVRLSDVRLANDLWEIVAKRLRQKDSRLLR